MLNLHFLSVTATKAVHKTLAYDLVIEMARALAAMVSTKFPIFTFQPQQHRDIQTKDLTIYKN